MLIFRASTRGPSGRRSYMAAPSYLLRLLLSVRFKSCPQQCLRPSRKTAFALRNARARQGSPLGWRHCPAVVRAKRCRSTTPPPVTSSSHQIFCCSSALAASCQGVAHSHRRMPQAIRTIKKRRDERERGASPLLACTQPAFSFSTSLPLSPSLAPHQACAKAHTPLQRHRRRVSFHPSVLFATAQDAD